MLSLINDLIDKIKLSNGQEYKLHLSFKDVLNWYEMLEDKELSDEDKIELSFEIFVGEIRGISFDEKAKAVNTVQKMITERPYGNNANNVDKVAAPKRFFSYTKDAEAIYASFMFDYNIDLLSCPGMRWEKFQALFSNLSEQSPFIRIVQIRQRDTSKLEGEELANVLELQNYYRLDDDVTTANLEGDIQNMFSMLSSNAVRKEDIHGK